MAGTDYVAQILNSQGALSTTPSDDASQKLYNNLNAYLQKLPVKQRQEVLSALVQSNKGGMNLTTTGMFGITTNDLQSIADLVQGNLTASFSGQRAPVPGSQVERAAQGPDLPSALPSSSVSPSPTASSGSGQTTPQSGASGPTTTLGQQPYGLNPDYTYQQYGKSQTGQPAGLQPGLTGMEHPGASVSGSDTWADLAASAGMSEQAFRAEYQAYVQHYGDFGGIKHGFQEPTVGPALTPQQYAETKSQAINGVWRPLIDALAQSWLTKYGSAMPADLRMQILQQFNQMGAQDKNALLSQVATVVGQLNSTTTTVDPAVLWQAALQSVPGSVQTLIGNYAQSHVLGDTLATQKAQAAQQFIQSYFGITGQNPTQKQIDNFTGMNGQEQQSYLDNVVVPGTSMTNGAYSAARGRMQSMWQQYYGRDPTAKEVQMAATWNQQDLQGYIDQSPSRLPGMNWGTYNSLQSAGSAISTRLFGSADSSQLIALFHQSGQGSKGGQ